MTVPYIALVYFKEKLAKDRQHHEVTDQLLRAWSHFYRRSDSNLMPCLLLDQFTEPPKFWKYDSFQVKECDPPERRDVLNKVGWMKAQAQEILGPCLLMDIDCLILKNIDHLADDSVPMAMPVDPAQRVYSDWPQVGEELNAGLMWMNSEQIIGQFRCWWELKKDPYFHQKTYFDEIIFSAICRGLKGKVLSNSYNGSWEPGNDQAMMDAAKDCHVLHFHGKRKAQLATYLSTVSIL